MKKEYETASAATHTSDYPSAVGPIALTRRMKSETISGSDGDSAPSGSKEEDEDYYSKTMEKES